MIILCSSSSRSGLAEWLHDPSQSSLTAQTRSKPVFQGPQALTEKMLVTFSTTLKMSDRFKFEARAIYNCDETGLTTVHRPPNVNVNVHSCSKVLIGAYLMGL